MKSLNFLCAIITFAALLILPTKCGIIDSQTDVGGWQELKSLSAPLDSDGDGLPDEWEIRYGLDSRDASNASTDRDSDGYTHIEEYLNGTDPTAFVDYTKPENNVNTLQHE